MMPLRLQHASCCLLCRSQLRSPSTAAVSHVLLIRVSGLGCLLANKQMSFYLNQASLVRPSSLNGPRNILPRLF
jgi:hypothetical protein